MSRFASMSMRAVKSICEVNRTKRGAHPHNKQLPALGELLTQLASGFLALEQQGLYQNHMHRALVCIACSIVLFVATVLAEEIELRPFKPIVDELIQSSAPDISELAYANARGAALCAAIAIFFEENSQREEEKKIASDYRSRASILLESAQIIGEMAGKSKEATRDQIGQLAKNYAERMLSSKQLNNKLLTPAIREDLEATSALQNAMANLLEKLEANLARNRK